MSLSNGVVKEVTIDYFKRGNVRAGKFNRNKAEVGYSQKQFRVGMNAKIVSLSENKEYCTVEFDNGVVREHVKLSTFFIGALSDKEPNVHIEYRVGDKVLQKCGEYAEILEKKADSKVVVRLDGGCIKEVNERWFRKGNVKPDFRKYVKVGDVVLQSCGHSCTVIGINGDKVDVIFDNGLKRFGVNKYSFANGKLSMNSRDNIRVGERVKQSCGEIAEVLELLPDRKCRVRFESGIEVESDRKKFRRGLLDYNKDDAKSKYLGMRIIAKNGIGLELVKYVNSNEIVVKSEDGKVSKTKLSIFLTGSSNLTNSPIRVSDKDIIGMKIKQKCGLVAECIDLREGGNYVIVRYETGYCKSVHRKTFINGDLTLLKSELVLYKTYTNSLGMKYTVIPSNTKSKFNVRFEDDSELEIAMGRVYNNSVYPDKLDYKSGRCVRLKSNKNLMVLSAYFDVQLKRYICIAENEISKERSIIVL